MILVRIMNSQHYQSITKNTDNSTGNTAMKQRRGLVAANRNIVDKPRLLKTKLDHVAISHKLQIELDVKTRRNMSIDTIDKIITQHK